MSRRGSRATAWARLLRLPNLVTAVADVAAGLALAGGPVPLDRAALLLLAGPCLYGGGVVLNDWCDRTVDAIERPGRPLPSGAVNPAAGLLVAVTLLAAGVLLAAVAGRLSGWVGTAIAGLAIAYDAGLKRQAVAGTMAIATCRLLDVGLGMTAAPVGHGDLILALPLALYVAAVMPLSRVEVAGDRRSAPPIGRGTPPAPLASRHRSGWRPATCALLTLALLALAAATGALLAWGGLFAPQGAIAVAVVAAAAMVATLPPLARPTPDRLQGAIQRILLGLIPLDAALALGSDRPWAAIAILALLPAALYLARRIPMT